MQQNVLLKDYTTLRLGGPAQFLATANTTVELEQLVSQASTPIMILGQGSNIVVNDQGFAGLVILNRIKGYEVIEQDPACAKVKIGAGEIWDDVVAKSVEAGLSGIECLSAIPGYTGAAPVQNIGAYGQEIADTLIELEAYDTKARQYVTLSNADCNFTYRKSIFNSGSEKGRYIITSITLELKKTILEPPFYSSLQQYLDSHQITDYNPYNLRAAVIAIRSVKLPDPKTLPNVGSFFRNPLVEKWQAEQLQSQFPDVKIFPMNESMSKVAAGWLIEQSGLKGLEMEGFKVYPENALVIINTGNGTYEGLERIKQYIIDTVRDKFRIILEQEPEEVGV